MKTYIILLRGVMPSGKNKVPMAELREILKSDGFQNVSTYIQSGNVILKSSDPAKKIEQKVKQLIEKNIGAELAVIAKTPQQIKKILDGNPFKDEDIFRVFFSILSTKPEAASIKEINNTDFYPEKVVVKNDAAYMFIPGSAARSKLSNNFLEKKLNVSSTTRNFNTLSKLVELSTKS